MTNAKSGRAPDREARFVLVDPTPYFEGSVKPDVRQALVWVAAFVAALAEAAMTRRPFAPPGSIDNYPVLLHAQSQLDVVARKGEAPNAGLVVEIISQTKRALSRAASFSAPYNHALDNCIGVIGGLNVGVFDDAVNCILMANIHAARAGVSCDTLNALVVLAFG